MTKDEFAIKVRFSARDISSAAVGNAIDHHHEIGKFRRQDVPAAVALARRFDVATLQEEAAGHKNLNTISTDVETAAISLLLTEKIKPEVEKLRIRIFGKSDPPFPDYEDAVDWIERECHKGKPELSASEMARYDKEYNKELSAFADRWSAVFGYRETIQPERPGLRYAHLGLKRVIKVGYWTDSRIGALHDFAERASKRTGFPEHAVVAYLLSGIEPFIPDVSMSWPTMLLTEGLPEITVTFRRVNIRELDFRKAYSFVKEKLGGKRPNSLKAKDLAIIKAIRELGGIPPVKKGKFWVRVQEMLVNEGITDLGPNGVRVRFTRLKKKGIGSDLLALLGA